MEMRSGARTAPVWAQRFLCRYVDFHAQATGIPEENQVHRGATENVMVRFRASWSAPMGVYVVYWHVYVLASVRQHDRPAVGRRYPAAMHPASQEPRYLRPVMRLARTHNHYPRGLARVQKHRGPAGMRSDCAPHTRAPVGAYIAVRMPSTVNAISLGCSAICWHSQYFGLLSIGIC